MRLSSPLLSSLFYTLLTLYSLTSPLTSLLSQDPSTGSAGEEDGPGLSRQPSLNGSNSINGSLEGIPQLLNRLKGLGSSSVEYLLAEKDRDRGGAGGGGGGGGAGGGGGREGEEGEGRGRRRRNSDGEVHNLTSLSADPSVPVSTEGSGPGAGVGRGRCSHCVRVEVRAVSKYKICSADPQGDERLDNWAVVAGTFSQTFLIELETCRLAMSDRLITIDLAER